MAIPKGYLFAAKVGLIAGLVAYAYHFGYSNADNKARAEWAEANVQADTLHREQIAQAVERVKQVQTQRSEVTRHVQQKTIEVPVYRECRHDPSVWNDIQRALGKPVAAASGDVPTGPDTGAGR